MENKEMLVTLPVLKPIKLKNDFINKIKGGSLKSDVIVLVAEDGEYVFFIECVKELKDGYNDKDILPFSIDEGVLKSGKFEKINLAKGIKLSKIFKIKYDEIIGKLDEIDKIDSLPFLGINDQIKLVDKLTTKLQDTLDLPKLIVIQKSQKTQNTSSQTA
ncbi:hypothetical protein MBVG596_0135 [Mycoplasmopsis bovigenitalium]|uniref:hypothetical protein n=1 Tax=Mycoplasmopsis bovigenitalium TaxID=2112 RepID=UPI00090BC59D|nr:hypothetical protein [Mycoplasmopsis bovigenitalium]BAW18050.1 hypothetical protein MBVG596_0135 [Mycoplasmopsis bovigenitalium]